MRPSSAADAMLDVIDTGDGAPKAAIETRRLVKRFGRADALNGLDLRVPQGAVYALLGRNGAGKSTLIQLLMGMLEPTTGLISVLDLDPSRDGVKLKQRLGYIPERLPMYDWMTVGEILRFVAGFYTNWSSEDEAALVAKFRIKRDQKVGALSRGNRALLSLVIAMAHRPELVLLDECTSGMDAIARREFERSVIDALQEGGRTILFAGHQIDEMERICDWVGVLNDGRMLVEMPLDDLKASVQMLRFAADGQVPDALPGCAILTRRSLGNDLLLTVRLNHPRAPFPSISDATVLEIIPMSLEEIFVALVEAEEAK
jgi:ABC-2 type transport system ATP-binding protein